MNTVKRIWGASDLARYLEVSVVTIHAWTRNGVLPQNDLILGNGTKLWSYDIISEIKKLQEDGKIKNN